MAQTNEFEAKLKIAELTYELNKARDRIHTLEEDNDKLSQLKKYEPFLKLGDSSTPHLRLIEKKGVITAPMMDME